MAGYCTNDILVSVVVRFKPQTVHRQIPLAPGQIFYTDIVGLFAGCVGIKDHFAFSATHQLLCQQQCFFRIAATVTAHSAIQRQIHTAGRVGVLDQILGIIPGQDHTDPVSVVQMLRQLLCFLHRTVKTAHTVFICGLHTGRSIDNGNIFCAFSGDQRRTGDQHRRTDQQQKL